MKILIVDDSPSMRKILRANLARAGAENILEAGDGVEALSLLKQNRDTGLILLDWNMPRMDGIEFLGEIKSRSALKKIPVVMVSTEEGESKVQEALTCGAIDFIVKPALPKLFQNAVGDRIAEILEMEEMVTVFERATRSTFRSFAGIPLELVSIEAAPSPVTEKDFTATLQFAGKRSGTAAICLDTALIEKISRKAMEIPETETVLPEISQDAARELINHIVGKAKATSKGQFVLETPNCQTGPGKPLPFAPSGCGRRLTFACQNRETFPLILWMPPKKKSSVDRPMPLVLLKTGKFRIDPEIRATVDGYISESEKVLQDVRKLLEAFPAAEHDFSALKELEIKIALIRASTVALGFEDLGLLLLKAEKTVKGTFHGKIPFHNDLGPALSKMADLAGIMIADLKKGNRHKPWPLADTLAHFNAIHEPSESPQVLEIDDDMQEIVEGFVLESEESLEAMDQDLVNLDGDPENPDLVQRVFRGLHTLKGNSRALGFGEMETVVHRTEDVIRKVRDGETPVHAELMDAVFQGVDMVKTLLKDVKERKKVKRDFAPVMQQLGAVLAGKAPSPQEETLQIDEDMKEIVEGFVIESNELLEEMDRGLVELEERPDDKDLINRVFRGLHTLKGNSRALGFEKLEELDHRTEDVIRAIRDGKIAPDRLIMDVVLKAVDSIKSLVADIGQGVKSNLDTSPILRGLDAALAGQLDRLSPPPQKKQPKSSSTGLASPATSTIRVDTEKLDRLVDVTGELILNKNRLLDFARALQEGRVRPDETEEFLEENNARLSYLMTDLQTSVLSTRMQPIGKVFGKYPRVVRDLARDSGKEIELRISGQDTEMDKTIVEGIGDPLIHLIRNACDHGIESPQDREKAGKFRKGMVELKAFYDSGSAIIEISDDGKGIRADQIRKKALEKDLISRHEAENMRESDVLNLIFLPGFSTAQKVTAVSGRGVGMDVVKSGITDLNGTIDLSSRPGQGSTIRIKLPLTLAIIAGLEIQVGPEHFLLPQECILNIVILPEKTAAFARNTGSFLFNNQETLRLLDLGALLAVPENGHGYGQKYVIVIGVGEMRAALLADNVIQTHEVVVKPLGAYAAHFAAPEIRGASIMGNGAAIMILDGNRLVQSKE